MNRILFSAIAILFFLACNQTGQVATHDDAASEMTEKVAESVKMVFPEDSTSADGKMSFHGLRIDESNSVPVVKAAQIFDEKGGAEGIKLTAPVEAACQAKGCWMTVKVSEDQEMRVTFRDYGFFVPKDAAGKTAIMEGNLFQDTTSVDRLRHLAVDGGMSEEEAEKTITKPEIAMSFEATGVIIKE